MTHITPEDEERMNTHRQSVLDLLKATISKNTGVPTAQVLVDPVAVEQIEKLDEETLESMVESLRQELEQQKAQEDNASKHKEMLESMGEHADTLCRLCGHRFAVGPIGKCPQCDSKMLMAAPKGVFQNRRGESTADNMQRIKDGIRWMREKKLWVGTARALEDMIKGAPPAIHDVLSIVTLNYMDWLLAAHASESQRDLMQHDIEAFGHAAQEAHKKN
jgi:hypothetical protein